MGAVGVHRLDAQTELPGDGPAVLALTDQPQDFKLTVGEPGYGRGGPRATAGQGIQNAARYLRTDINLSAQHLPDGIEDFFGPFLFHDVAAPAGAQNPLG